MAREKVHYNAYGGGPDSLYQAFAHHFEWAAAALPLVRDERARLGALIALWVQSRQHYRGGAVARGRPLRWARLRLRVDPRTTRGTPPQEAAARLAWEGAARVLTKATVT